MKAKKAKSENINMHKGFSLIELLICMGIIFLVSYFSLTPEIGKQTAKQEAERIEIWLARITQKAIRMRRSFEMTVTSNNTRLKIYWVDNSESEYFKATTGCKIELPSARSSVQYSSATNKFEGSDCTMTVTGLDKDSSNENVKHYVIISQTGRIRLSDTKP